MAKRYSIRETLQPIIGLVLVFKKVADRTLKPKLSITTAQFRVLMAVQHNPNLSQHAIAQFWGVTEASVSRQIEILNNKRFISKSQDPDNRRKYSLKLTKRGRSEIERASLLMNEIFEKIFKDVSDKDRRVFSSLSRRFISIIKECDSTQMENINKTKRR
jgi:DNA-binding MarR family transcriptional regulator